MIRRDIELSDRVLGVLVNLSFEEIKKMFGITEFSYVGCRFPSHYRIETKEEAERKRKIVNKFLYRF